MCVKWKKHLLRLTSFLLSLCLVCSLFILNSQPVKAVVGIDDALLWAAFTAGSFAGTAGEAALTGQIAHDEYGVKFGSQSQAQNFVKDFFTWALQSGGPLALTPQGQIANAAGQAVFTTGYKALAPHAIAARPSLSVALSMFLGQVVTGVTYQVIATMHQSLSFKYGSPAVNYNLIIPSNMSFSVVGKPTTNVNSPLYTTPSIYTYVTSQGSSAYFGAVGWRSSGLPTGFTVSGTTTSNMVALHGGQGYAAGFSGASATINVTSILQYAYSSDTNDYTCDVDVYPLEPSGYAADYSGVDAVGTGDGAIAMPVSGALNPSVPIGLGSQTDSYPMNDVINGADTSYADEQAGTLENVDASQLDAADAATAEGDTSIDPSKDWTQPKDGIDWSPILNIDLSKKFPFSLPWDFYTLASSINVTAVAPKWTIPLHFGFLDTSYAIDMSQYEWFVSKMRIFEYLVFLGIWIFGLYKIIKH